MSQKQDPKDTPRRRIPLDWNVVTVSLVGIALVIAASIQAGEGSLVSNLSNYIKGTP